MKTVKIAALAGALVAAAGLVLAIGVGVMFSGMSDLFNAWAGYFAGGS